MGLELLELIRKGLRVKGFLYVTIGNFVNAGLGFLFFFMAARIMHVENYGVLSYNISVGFLGVALTVLGLQTAIITFYPKEKNLEFVKQAATLSFLLDFVALVVVVVAVVLFDAPLLPAALIVFGGTAFSMYIGFTLGRQEYKSYALLITVMRVGQCVFLVLFYLFVAFTSWFMVWLEEAILLAYGIAYLAAGYRYFRLLNFNLSFNEVYARWRFCLPAAVSSVLTASLGSLDKVIIGSLFGMHSLGNYHLAFQFLTALMVIPTSLFSFLLPEKAGGRVRREVEVLGVAVAVLVSLTGIIAVPFFIKVFFPDFEGSISAIQLLSLSVVPASIAYIKLSELYSRERADLVMACHAAMFAVYIAGVVLLGGWLQMAGFALSYTAGQIVLAVISYVFTTSKWERWEAKRRKRREEEGQKGCAPAQI